MNDRIVRGCEFEFMKKQISKLKNVDTKNLRIDRISEFCADNKIYHEQNSNYGTFIILAQLELKQRMEGK